MKKFRWTFILVIVILITSSCTQVETEQEFTIISAYDGMADFVTAVQSDPEANRKALYQQYVLEPYWEDCTDGVKEFLPIAEGYVSRPISDMSGLGESIQSLQDSEVESIVMDALNASSQALPGPDVTLCIFAQDPDDYRTLTNGIDGFALDAGKIWIQITPKGQWQEWLPYGVAHEYHHVAWLDMGKYDQLNFTLTDYLMFEGRADSFAHQLYPDKRAPWTKSIDRFVEARQWDSMQEDLNNRSIVKQQEYMFGTRDQSILPWTGYTIGFGIVQSYLDNHPDDDPETWTALDASKLLERSGYMVDE